MKPQITVEALVGAPIEKVWEYFTNPDHIKNWYYASDDWCVPNATNNLVLNGRFLTRMESKDSTQGFDLEGVYTSVEPLEKIQYQIDDGRMVTIGFIKEGDAVRVVETFDPEDVNPIEMQKAGWQAILDNFKKYTE